jgi:hypothetical protein
MAGLNYRLIQDEDPTAASMTNYLTPVGLSSSASRWSANR